MCTIFPAMNFTSGLCVLYLFKILSFMIDSLKKNVKSSYYPTLFAWENMIMNDHNLIISYKKGNKHKLFANKY